MIIISQDFHNSRAVFIARHKGINAIAFNAGNVNLYDSLLTRSRELFASAKALLDIYIFDTGPRFSGEQQALTESCNDR